MRKLLNTLYVTDPDVFLSKENNTVVAKKNDEVIMRIPAINLESIVCFNYLGASPYLMKLCVENNIGLCFLTPSGNFLARVTGKVNGNVLLRRTQYRIADEEEESLKISRIMIAGKIYNARKVVERFKRDYVGKEDNAQVQALSRQLDRCQRLALKAATTEMLRGLEGEAALLYFSMFDQMIVAQKESFKFMGRNRRPPKDRVNCLLSFCYTLLAHEVQSALETVGLDPYVGFLHTDRPGRPGLALDMMEELRSYMADRMVLTLINKRQVSHHDFIENGANNIVMTDSCKRKVLSAWQKRKKETANHPFLNEKVTIGLFPYIQAMLLARHIRGTIEKYPVFLIQ
ncbi:MAG: type I-C CRISPR-associated endonuclease Cas1c [Prevotella sp.]|jgi:CRISPR-associated protein Cas1